VGDGQICPSTKTIVRVRRVVRVRSIKNGKEFLNKITMFDLIRFSSFKADRLRAEYVTQEMQYLSKSKNKIFRRAESKTQERALNKGFNVHMISGSFKRKYKNSNYVRNGRNKGIVAL